MRIVEGKVKSCNGINDLYYKVYEPESKPIGVLQVVHGMSEHIGRYDEFMRDACKLGYLVFGHDHVGHGKTAPSEEDWGYIAEKDGDKILVEDVGTVAVELKKKYGFDKRFLIGHSMGSFVTRIYASEHGDELLGYICMGTGGPNPAAKPGRGLSKAIQKRKGPRYISDFITNIMFGSYNKKTDGETYKAWLTRDVEEQRKNIADKQNNITFTISADIDLVNLVIKSNAKKWYENMKKDLPVYIVSGGQDPVGNYGKGPKQVYDRLLKTGHTDVTLKIWADDRHEVLNELDKAQVKAEIFEWMKTKNNQ